MDDQAAPFQPAWEQVAVPSRSRSEFAGYKAFGSGDGAVLMGLGITRRLRSAAEFAAQERRVAGGLLFGRGWADEQGGYLVIDGFLEAGPGENSGDRVRFAADGADQFTLSPADLRLLRQDAVRMYPASLEVGWWRTLAAPGEFSPRDFMTQAELAGPDGVGLLVYGSGVHWGTAYLGHDGHAPDTAGTLAVTADAYLEPAPEDAFPEPLSEPEPAAEPEHELVDIAAGEHLAQGPIPLADNVEKMKSTGLTPAAAGKPLRQQAKRRSSGRARRRAPAPTVRRVPSRVIASPWSQARAQGKLPEAAAGPEVPDDVRFVVGALTIVGVLAGIIAGILLHSLTAAVIIAAIVLLVIFAGVWLSRHR